MPRIRQYAVKYADADFLKEIQHQKIEKGVRSDRELSERIGLNKSSFCKRKQQVETFTVRELREIVKVLRPSPAVLLGLLGYTGKEIRDTVSEASGE